MKRSLAPKSSNTDSWWPQRSLFLALSLTLPGATLAINDILPLSSLILLPHSLLRSSTRRLPQAPTLFSFEDKGQGRRGACRGWEWGLTAGWPSFNPFLIFLQSPSAINEVIQSISFSVWQPAAFKVSAHHTWPFLFSHSTHTYTHVHIFCPFWFLINAWMSYLGWLLRCFSAHTRGRRERE